MDIKDYAQMMSYLTRPRDVVPDPSTMDQEPRNMAQGGRIPFGEAGFVVSDNTQKSKLKFTKKQNDLAEKVYGKSMKELYKTDRNKFYDIRYNKVKETTQAGKGAKIKDNIYIPTKDVKQPDGTIKKVQLPIKYPNKKVEKKFKEAVRDIFKNPAGNIPYKTLAKDFPITENRAVAAAKQIKKEEGLEFAKGRTSQEYIKEVRNPALNKTTSRRVEKRMGLERSRFLKDKPEVFGKIDTAHRASKSHMAKLGLEFDTQLVGMDSRLINQVVLKPAENMLDKLYERRENILDNTKGKPTKEQKKILKEINNSVKKVVKTTSGRFVGIIVDPNNLNPSFTGIKKDLAFSKVNKTMKEIEKLPGAPAVTGGFQNNIKDNEYFKFIKNNVQKSVSGEIKRGFVPNDFKVILSDPKNRKSLLNYAKKNAPDILPQFKKILDNPTSKQSVALFSNPFFDPKLMGKVIGDMGTVLGTPSSMIGLNAAFGIDPRSSLDRAILGAEAAFLPAGVKAATNRISNIKNPLLRKGIETLAGVRIPGIMTPANALKIARAASPIGIATLGGEGLYQLGKLGYEDQKRFNALSPEEQAAERAEQEKFAFDVEGS